MNKKFIKLIPGLITMAMTVNSVAAMYPTSTPQVPVAQSNTSYYLGFDLGIDQLAPERTVTSVPPGGTVQITTATTDHANGFIGGGFIGIEHRMDQFSVAGEIAGNYVSSATQATTTNLFGLPDVTAKVKVRHQGNFTFSVLPAYYFNDKTKMFLRAGYSLGDFTVKSLANTGGDLIATGSTSKWLSGYIVGGGFSTKITDMIDARLEYDYSHYSSISSGSILDPDFGSATVSSKVTPANHAVTLGLVFNNPFGEVFS